MGVGCVGASSTDLFSAITSNTTAEAEQTPFDLNKLLSFNVSEESLEEQQAALEAKVRQKLHEAGIELDQPLVLTSDSSGYVRVQGDVPHKDEIEKIFADNRELQQGYAKISAETSFLRAVQNQQKFIDEYERLKGNLAAQKALVDAEVAKNNQPVYVTIKPYDTELASLFAA